MNNLSSQIAKDLVLSQKEKNEAKVSTLRMLRAAIKNEEIAKKKKEGLSSEEIEGIIKHEVKRRNDAIESYKSGNRNDLVAKEEQEKEILKQYLPQEMSEEEVKKVVEKVIKTLGEMTQKDFGKVMGQVMRQLKGKADGNLVSKIVKENLSH